MARIPLADIEGNVYQRAMGHRPEIVDQWFALDSSIRFSGVLSPSLKEEVRRVLAPGIGCTFCASLGDPSPESRDKKTALAVGFAQTIFDNVKDLRSIDDEHFEVMRGEFTDAEIIELISWTLFMVAAQGFGALLRLPPATADELEEYIDWRAVGEKDAA